MNNQKQYKNLKALDRGIIKWQPFDSCFNSANVIKDINNQKKKVSYPTMSEDQLNNLNTQIFDAYTLKLRINIAYYYNGEIKNIQGQINYIDQQHKTLFLDCNKIYFKQILNINVLENAFC